MTERIPGPKGHWLVGSLNDMRQDFLQFLVTTSRDYGSITQFRAGPARMVLVSDPEAIADILVKRPGLFYKTGSTKKLLSGLLGNGLVSLEGNEHRRHRTVMQPAFHTRQVQHYTQVVIDHTRAWLERRQDGETLDIVPALADLMLDIVVATFFSANLTETGQIRSALHSFSKALDLRVRSPIALPGWLPTEGNRILKQAVATLDATVYRLIAERREMADPPADLLTMLLNTQDEDSGQPLNNQEIRDEIATIFFAGYETTTTTLAWVWYLLSQHPAVREKLLVEIGQNDEQAHPQQMPYLDQVIKEVLRLYPAAWLFDREPAETVTLGGYTIPARQTLFISPYLVHRNPAYFDEPDMFRPERFQQGAEKQVPRFAYFPFGGGPRVCIGQPFALHTMMLVLVTLLPRLNFELLPGQAIQPAAAATLVPAGGIQMRLQRL